MSLPQYVVAAALGLLGLLGVLRVIRPIGDVVDRADIYLLVPDSKFFAPTPNRSDYHLTVRHRANTGLPGAWRTIESSRRRGYAPKLADPHRRVRKALVDVGTHAILLGRAHHDQPPERVRPTVTLSMTYLLLLGVASARARGHADVQFCLLTTRADATDEGEVLLVSDHHPVEQAGGPVTPDAHRRC
ncbi:MAG: hypothetical protein HOQ24_06305 [Mycobacteriaceae bacterium]|nr:hypothetical protein [Mycobacteriaceae bacterium]